MSDQDRRQAEPREDGVFGKLPSARPSVRSPRREAGSTKGRSPDFGTGSPGGRPPDTPGQSPGPSPPTEPEAAREPEAAHGHAPGVEDLAWAGIAVAAEAATLGVRIVSRAIGAVRKPTDYP